MKRERKKKDERRGEKKKNELMKKGRKRGLRCIYMGNQQKGVKKPAAVCV
jgi:hypothetical protein